MEKRWAKMSVRVMAAFILAMCMFSFAGCSKKGGIEGTWVLIEEYEADGTKISGKELKETGVSETYEIEGTTVKYILEMKDASKPITMELELEELGDNRYNIKIPNSSVIFATACVEGNKMIYYVGEGDDRMKMVYKRQ